MDVKDLLQRWNIPQDVVENFIANGITVEIMGQLSSENMKELCPHIATRLKLTEKILELLNAYAPTETNSVSGTEQESVQQNENEIEINDDNNMNNLTLTPAEGTSNANEKPIRKNFPNFDLATLLQTSAGGSSILKYYETNGFLNHSKRNLLVDIIIKHIYTHIVNCGIIYEEYNVIAAKVISLFPKECMGTYYTKPISKRNSLNGRSTIARGKLVDKVRNCLYKYGDTRKRSSTSELQNTPPTKKRIENLQSEHMGDILFLNNNSEPWDEVIQKWKNTFPIRKESEYENVNDFLKSWKILEDQRSNILINVDFDLLYPEKGLNFFWNWNTFFEKLIHLKVPQDEGIKNLIESMKNLDDDSKIPIQIKVLAHLVPPKGRISKKIKFTTQESIESLYICVPNSGDIDQVIKEQKEKAKAKKLTIQPYVILQGTVQACTSPLIIVDEVRYQFTSISKAFDTLFKLYHTFNVRYPKAGDHLYLIIQRCVYKIETKYDNVVSYINDVLNM